MVLQLTVTITFKLTGRPSLHGAIFIPAIFSFKQSDKHLLSVYHCLHFVQLPPGSSFSCSSRQYPASPTMTWKWSSPRVNIECDIRNCHKRHRKCGWPFGHELCKSTTSPSSIDPLKRRLQVAINRISQWTSKNGFTFSAAKTRCVYFTRKHCIYPPSNLCLKSIRPPLVPSVRFLGLIFDSKLSGEPHLPQLLLKWEKTLKILNVLSKSMWGEDWTVLCRLYRTVAVLTTVLLPSRNYPF